MKYTQKKITTVSFLIYAAVNVFTYLFAHVAYLFSNDIIGGFFEYVSYYLAKTVEFLAPPTIAAVALLLLLNHGKSAVVKFSFAVASARILYSLPYYYLIFIYNYRYDSLESISLALAAGALVILLTVGGTLVSITLAFMVIKRTTGGTDAIKEAGKRTATLDFLAIGNLPVLTFALARFAFSLITELVDTVSFFISYRSDYLPIEIITMLVNYVLLFILLVASYLIASTVKKLLITKTEE